MGEEDTCWLSAYVGSNPTPRIFFPLPKIHKIALKAVMILQKLKLQLKDCGNCIFLASLKAPDDRKLRRPLVPVRENPPATLFREALIDPGL